MKCLRLIAATVTLASVLGSASAHASDSLVTTDWLEKNLGNPQVPAIEVSVNPGVYERGHIPGAVNFVWHGDLVDRVRRDLVGRENFQALLQQAGISPGTTVVLYGDTNNWFAGWGAWVFDIYGVEGVKLLDGGRRKWEAEGRPLANRPVVYPKGAVQVRAADETLRARLADFVAVAEKRSDKALIDIRSADEYSGKIIAPQGIQELAVRAGHIPGAVNVPWSEAVAADGTFKPVAELRKLYAEKGIDGSKPIITYCRIGERSSHTWFALKKLLGYEVANYDGSWTEYGNAVGVPIINLANTIWTGK